MKIIFYPSIRVNRLNIRDIGSDAAGASRQSRAIAHNIYQIKLLSNKNI